MDKNDDQLSLGSPDAHLDKDLLPSVPTEGKIASLAKRDALMPTPDQSSLSVVALSAPPATRSPGKSKAELWNDTASKDLVDESMRRKDLERKLTELERTYQNAFATQDATLRSQMREIDASHNKRWRFLWGALLAISAVLCCLSFYFAWEFLECQKNFRELKEQLILQPQLSFSTDARHVLAGKELTDLWDQVSKEARIVFVETRASAMWRNALLATILAILSGICPALVLLRLEHWWRTWTEWKGMIGGIIAAVVGVGALFLMIAVWINFGNAGAGAVVAFVTLFCRSYYIRLGLRKEGVFSSFVPTLQAHPSKNEINQLTATDARTETLLEQLNSTNPKSSG